jgi:hypothetical protein
MVAMLASIEQQQHFRPAMVASIEQQQEMVALASSSCDGADIPQRRFRRSQTVQRGTAAMLASSSRRWWRWPASSSSSTSARLRWPAKQEMVARWWPAAAGAELPHGGSSHHIDLVAAEVPGHPTSLR